MRFIRLWNSCYPLVLGFIPSCFLGMTVQICNICNIMQVPEKMNSLNFVIKFLKSPRIKVNETCMDYELLNLFMVFRC